MWGIYSILFAINDSNIENEKSYVYLNKIYRY